MYDLCTWMVILIFVVPDCSLLRTLYLYSYRYLLQMPDKFIPDSGMASAYLPALESNHEQKLV